MLKRCCATEAFTTSLSGSTLSSGVRELSMKMRRAWSADVYICRLGAHNPAGAQQAVVHLRQHVRYLCLRKIHDAGRGLVEAFLLHVADHPDNFAVGIIKAGAVRSTDSQVLADGVFTPLKKLRAISWLMTTTGAEPLVSLALRLRPASTGIWSASK